MDNCIFINNTALSDTNAGAISNYGNEDNKSYLFVNNSLFMGNHADHDGGAVTTCYANSDIYNSVFVNNSACRDGGAIRVSVFGYGNVEDCIFIYNHADEWGGAYYSWAGKSQINRCIFLNNTSGTNGGAVMVSGDLSLTNSIIVNNTSNETGGSFYIQQPMFDAVTVIRVENNIITNNTSPLGQEIFVKWKDTNHLLTNFNNNNWGEEDPSDPSVIDPNNVSSMIHPSSVNHNYSLLYNLNFGLINRYSDILNKYYPNFTEDFVSAVKHDNTTTNSNNRFLIKLDNSAPKKSVNVSKIKLKKTSTKSKHQYNNLNDVINKLNTKQDRNQKIHDNKISSNEFNSNLESNSNSTYSPGDNKKAVEVFKDTKKSVKSLKSFDYKYILGLVIIFLVLLIGFLKRKDMI